MSSRAASERSANEETSAPGGDWATTAIVPTFNRARLLKECLDSILAQTLRPAQIIVINDGSDDHTAEVLHRFAKAIDVVTMANRGKSAGANRALTLAKHPLVWIVDDDDLVLPGALAQLTGMLQSDPQAGFAYGRYNRFVIEPRTGRQRIFDTGYWNNCPPEEFLIATLEDFFVHHPGMLVRRSLYDRVGPFNESLPRSQDYDMLIRLARLSRPVATEKTVFLQRQHDGTRGVADQPFSADQREGKWIEADKQILAHFYRNLTLSDYLPSRRIDGPADKRRALLQRAAIMARKKLWTYALGDFRTAAALGEAALSEAEKVIIKRAVLSKYGCDELLTETRIARRVQALGRNSSGGRQIARAMARGLLWRVREKLSSADPSAAARFARLWGSWMAYPPANAHRTARAGRRLNG